MNQPRMARESAAQGSAATATAELARVPFVDDGALGDDAPLKRGPTYCDVTADGSEYRPNGYCALGDCGLQHDRRVDGRPTYCCSAAHTREWKRNHMWGAAKAAVKKRDRACVRCHLPRGGDNPEVNHIVPREGSGYGTGCWNHQDNLELLCHDCHVGVTAEQARARARNGAAA